MSKYYMNKIKRYFFKRLSEPSTWMGILALISAFGVDFTEMQQAAITAFGLALFAAPDKQHV